MDHRRAGAACAWSGGCAASLWLAGDSSGCCSSPRSDLQRSAPMLLGLPQPPLGPPPANPRSSLGTCTGSTNLWGAWAICSDSHTAHTSPRAEFTIPWLNFPPAPPSVCTMLLTDQFYSFRCDVQSSRRLFQAVEQESWPQTCREHPPDTCSSRTYLDFYIY